jgi:hypothetical protein
MSRAGRKRKQVVRLAPVREPGKDMAHERRSSEAVTGNFRLAKPTRSQPPQLPRAKVSMANVSITAVERRLIRACKTIRALPDREKRFQGSASSQGVWGNIVQDFMDAYGSDDVVVRFSPSPADVSDCLVALSWCKYLEKNEFSLIWWRSFGVSFGVIAGRIGRSDETARRRYTEAMQKVWYASVH